MNKERVSDKYRVSGAKINAELKRLEELKIKATKRYLERLDHELKMETIDSRRDW